MNRRLVMFIFCPEKLKNITKLKGTKSVISFLKSKSLLNSVINQASQFIIGVMKTTARELFR